MTKPRVVEKGARVTYVLKIKGRSNVHSREMCRLQQPKCSRRKGFPLTPCLSKTVDRSVNLETLGQPQSLNLPRGSHTHHGLARTNDIDRLSPNGFDHLQRNHSTEATAWVAGTSVLRRQFSRGNGYVGGTTREKAKRRGSVSHFRMWKVEDEIGAEGRVSQEGEGA